jgi:hypothetical protein
MTADHLIATTIALGAIVFACTVEVRAPSVWARWGAAYRRRS